MHRDYSHEITVYRPFSEAIQLFSPKGEETWVPGWNPNYIVPSTGETREEMIFTTGDGEETTFWTCLKWQPKRGHARYFRLTPQSRVGIVDVQCQTEGSDRTRVRVNYQMQPLSSAGHSYLDAMTQSAFVSMIDEWASLIQKLDK